MPSKRDNDEERFARIASLMEEYRVNHEDLEAYVKAVRDQGSRGRTQTRSAIKSARERFRRVKR